jgi:hypothetical protein
VQVEHRRKVQIASGSAKFDRHCLCNLFHEFDVSSLAKLSRCGPGREWFAETETCSSFLIDADEYRSSRGAPDFRRESEKAFHARKIALIYDDTGKPALKIAREFAGQ